MSKELTLALASVLAASALIVSACTGSVEELPGRAACSPTAESIQATIFATSCAGVGCHGSDVPALGLDLGGSPEALVGRSSLACGGWALVVPGSPESSFLYEKVAAAQPACGEHMPLDGQLSDADLTCLRDWISSLSASGCETCGGDACVSLASDPLNCGTCGHACAEGISCQNGACACPEGTSSCDGACVDVQSDPAHCGSCEIACSPGATCESGACSCPESLSACGGTCADLQSDPDHCGDCDTACNPSQVCLLGACSSGCGDLEQCGSSCVDTQTNVLNCGACGNVCPGGLPCVGGECRCPEAGQTLCGSACIDVTSDPNHCGGCGTVCGSGDSCVEGTCQCDADDTLSYAGDIEPWLTAACTGTGCHSGRRPQEGLSFEVGQSYAQLVGVASSQCKDRLRVAPGSPSTSYLMNKLLGVDLCFGTQMPKADQQLPEEQLAAIASWICAGAPN